MQESALLHGSVSDTNDTGMINSVVVLNSAMKLVGGEVIKVEDAVSLTS